MTFGITEASAVGPNVTYFACLNKGKLSHVGTTTPATCPSTAMVISWNSQGLPGSPGTNGTNGTNGISHGYGNNNGSLTFVDLNDQWVENSVTVPTGDYVVTAHLNFQITGATTESVVCSLVDSNGTFLDTGVQHPLPSGSDGNITLSGVEAESAGTTFSVKCEQTVAPPDSVTASSTINAIAVNALN